ncbi:hypothetical protein ANCCAN_30271, partial [Ancylostoma caninum]
MLAMEIERDVREYVRSEHVDFLETRFRTFDEYMVSMNPESFLMYTRFYPSEFEEFYQNLAHSLVHPPTHLAPICGRRRLCLYLSLSAWPDAKSDITVYFARAFPLPTRVDFEQTARKTQVRYDYPRACGFLDGKHIAIL